MATFVICMQANAEPNKAEQTATSDNPALSAPNVAPQQIGGPALQGKGNQDTGNEMRIISTPAKDRYDKAAVWINLALAVIGTVGIGAAITTLRKLERQTKGLHTQRLVYLSGYF